jgi:hypothetical protein
VTTRHVVVVVVVVSVVDVDIDGDGDVNVVATVDRWSLTVRLRDRAPIAPSRLP